VKKIYVASSWRNDIQPEIVKALREAGHLVYDFKNPRPGDTGFSWSEIDQDWKNWEPEEFRSALDHEIAKSGFNSDFDAMKWADTCVLVLPCGRSAHLEAGWFTGQGKTTLIFSPEKTEPELMYLLAGKSDNICVSLPELIAALETEP
jgi:hypothetical protein